MSLQAARPSLDGRRRALQAAIATQPRLRADWPRRARLALAGCWAIDALLQLQPANFSGALVYETILGNAEHQPSAIAGSLIAASRLLAPVHVELNVLIVFVQLAIAGGLIWRRTAKLALAASIPWALGVWWLGEGFGGVFAGTSTLLVGFPGPALLYALLALVAWPRERTAGRCLATAGALGERATAAVWALLWIGGAILRASPFWFPPVYALVGDLQEGLDAEPRWLLHLNLRLSGLASAAGIPLVIAIALLEAAIGVGVLTRHRRLALAAGILLATVYWVIGQQLASLLSGQATDIAAGPLYILLALSLWPRRFPEGGDPSGLPARIASNRPEIAGLKQKEQIA